MYMFFGSLHVVPWGFELFQQLLECVVPMHWLLSESEVLDLEFGGVLVVLEIVFFIEMTP